MAYRAADNPDRMKALGGVLVVHVGLAALILSGLTVHTVAQTVERLQTFDILEPPPPPIPPPPRPTPERAKDQAGAAAKQALPTPVMAPPPRIVLPFPPPVTAARIASTGSAGAATAGKGTGAGGSGNGLGGGSNGDFSGYTPARLIRNLSRGDYRLIAGDRLPRGAAMMSLRVEPDGQPSNCRVVRSSGDPTVDGELCPLVTQRLRFRPALNDLGRPIAYQVQYVATWDL